jgi:hypothetical protein
MSSIGIHAKAEDDHERCEQTERRKLETEAHEHNLHENLFKGLSTRGGGGVHTLFPRFIVLRLLLVVIEPPMA